MFILSRIRYQRRRGSSLLPTLFVMVLILTLLSAIMPLTLSGYCVARADRDRAGALAAAEAGLNWEIGRINNRLWDKDDSGQAMMDRSGSPALDYWTNSAGAAPSTASTVVLTTDASGNWTQRFLVGTNQNPYTVSPSGWFILTAEGQVRAADGRVVKRRVQCGGATGGPSLFSLFDTEAVFALSPATASSSTPAWSMGGSSSVTGGCGSNGTVTGNGNPSIMAGPLTLWGSNASISGVTVASGVQTLTRPVPFWTPTADQAANLLRSGALTGPGVSGWKPTGYDGNGGALGPVDSFGRPVNSQAQIVSKTDSFVRSVAANEFLDGNGYLVLDHHIAGFKGTNKLRLRPGVYYFHQINLNDNDFVEIANDWYLANGVTPLVNNDDLLVGAPGSVADYDSAGNRITIFVDAVTGSAASSYADSSIGSAFSANLQGDRSAANPVRYRRPGNFRIYAKNSGNFSVKGSSSNPAEFNCNLLHYNADPSGNFYGAISLSSGCHLYGGLFGWTISMSGGANVQQYGTGIFGSNDPVTVIPSGGGKGGVSGGFGGWHWTEIAAG